MSKPEYRTFADTAELDSQLAKDVASALAGAVSSKGRAVLVVSGGSTPKGFFRLLSGVELPWQRITVTLADERWLEPDHADSNEKLVRENLLTGAAKAATFLPLKNAAIEAVDGESALDEALAELGRFDVVILGMGGDGHTASLFPQAPALSEALRMDSGKQCLAMEPVTAPHTRMTLTLPRLLDSDQIIVHITGDSKKAILESALESRGEHQYPIANVLLQQQTPVTIYWCP